jgi:hypothetical protein
MHVVMRRQLMPEPVHRDVIRATRVAILARSFALVTIAAIEWCAQLDGTATSPVAPMAAADKVCNAVATRTAKSRAVQLAAATGSFAAMANAT